MEEEPGLEEAARHDERVARLLETARALENLPRHASTHAAGVVIGDRPLVDYLPLYCVASDQGGDSDKVVVTQFDMKGVEEIGLIKFDFLGLKTLTLINHALKLIKEKGHRGRHGPTGPDRPENLRPPLVRRHDRRVPA